jgi:PAS domain S-box-containing protein
MTAAARTLGHQLRFGYAVILSACACGLAISGTKVGTLFAHDVNHSVIVNEAGRQRFLGAMTVHRALLSGQGFESTLAAWSAEQNRVEGFVRPLCESDELLCSKFESLQSQQRAIATLARAQVAAAASTREQHQALESALDAYLESADRWVGDLSSRLAEMTLAQERLIWAWLAIMVVVATSVVMFVLEPITRRLQRDRTRFDAHAQERERLAVVVELMHDAVTITDAAGRIEWVNAGFVRLTGFSAEAALTHTIAELLSGPQGLLAAHGVAAQGYALTEGFLGEFLHFHRSGREFWGSVESRALRVADGQITGFITIETDITIRRAVEQALERKRAFLDASSRVAGVGGWEWDLRTDEIVWSEETCRIHGVDLGYQPKLDQAIRFYAPEARPLIEAAVARGIREGKGWDLELPFIRATGERIWVRAVGEVEFQDGNPVRLCGAFQDITARKLIEEKSRRDAAELQRLNGELEQFVYAASHDLRAPLRAVAALADWIIEDDPSIEPKTSERLDLIRGRVRRMTRMLDDILEYARFGSEGALAGEPMTAAALAADVIQTLDLPGNFCIDIDPELHAALVTRMPLARVLHNLLGNAIKHHDRDAGLIALSVVTTLGWHRFTVSDDGPGIPEDRRTAIFDMFTTLKPRDQVDGSGMGLAMVRKIVTQQGADCGVEARTGRGACFWFDWPRQSIAVRPIT